MTAEFDERVTELAARATRHRREFEPPSDPPDEERALRYLTRGVGAAVSAYVEIRAGDGGPVAVDSASFAALEDALNEWLELYAACYGHDIEAEFSVREAAELVLSTHDLRDVAYLLTKVPSGATEPARNVK